MNTKCVSYIQDVHACPSMCCAYIYMSRDLRFKAAWLKLLNKVERVSSEPVLMEPGCSGYWYTQARESSLGSKIYLRYLPRCMPIFGLVSYGTRGRSHACHQQLKGSVARQVECQGVATASSLDDKCSAEVIIS